MRKTAVLVTVIGIWAALHLVERQPDCLDGYVAASDSAAAGYHALPGAVLWDDATVGLGPRQARASPAVRSLSAQVAHLHTSQFFGGDARASVAWSRPERCELRPRPLRYRV